MHFGCGCGEGDLLKFKASIKMSNKGDRSDFERGSWCQTGCRSENCCWSTGVFTQPSLGFSENDPKSSSSSCVEENTLLVSGKEESEQDRKRKATGNQINTEVCRVARLNASNLETGANVYALTGHSIRHEQGVPNYKVVYECIQMSRWDICFEDQMHVKTNYGWTAFRQSNVNKLSALLCFIYT